MPEIEERTAKIEGILEQMSERINDLRADFTSLRSEVGGLRQEMGSLRQEVRSEIGGLRQEMGGLRQEIHDNFRWMMATLIGSWATIVGITIAMFAIMR